MWEEVQDVVKASMEEALEQADELEEQVRMHQDDFGTTR